MYSVAETMDEIERGVDFREFEPLWQTLKAAVLAIATNNNESAAICANHIAGVLCPFTTFNLECGPFPCKLKPRKQDVGDAAILCGASAPNMSSAEISALLDRAFDLAFNLPGNAELLTALCQNKR